VSSPHIIYKDYVMATTKIVLGLGQWLMAVILATEEVEIPAQTKNSRDSQSQPI
jgi:hypothetical protein